MASILPLLILGGGAALALVMKSPSKPKQQQPQPLPGAPPGSPGIPPGTMPANFPFPLPGGLPHIPGAPGFPPMTPPDGSFFMVDNGCWVIRPEKQPMAYAALANKTAGENVTGPTYPKGTVRVSDPSAQWPQPALAWIEMESRDKGNMVLMTMREPPLLASVPPGEERVYAAAARNEWAILAQGQPVQQQPGGAGATPPSSTPPTGPGIVLPGGLGTIPIGYPTQPASTTPPTSSTTPPDSRIELPGLGQVPNPFPQGAPPGTPPSSTPPTAGQWPMTHTHAIRPGDIASALAKHFTGDFRRAEELRVLNLLTQEGTGANTRYTPWKVGQILKLPLSWPVVEKGPAPMPKGLNFVQKAQAQTVQKQHRKKQEGSTVYVDHGNKMSDVERQRANELARGAPATPTGMVAAGEDLPPKLKKLAEREAAENVKRLLKKGRK